jgi:SOS response regulatory protein OraA/RecX
MQRPVLDAALKLLAARSRTEAELRKALISREYPPPDVESAVARVRELGYLDDGEVARARARSLLGRGAAPQNAARRLEAQGIAPAQARTAVEGEAGEEGEAGLLERALERRLKGRDGGAGFARDGRRPEAVASMTEKEKQRVFRSLVQKGFRPSAVARRLGLDWDGDDDDDR